MPKDLEERIKQAISNHMKMGHSKEEAIEKTSQIFQQANSDYIEYAADEIYGESMNEGSNRRTREKRKQGRKKKEPEMMEGSGKIGKTPEELGLGPQEEEDEGGETKREEPEEETEAEEEDSKESHDVSGLPGSPYPEEESESEKKKRKGLESKGNKSECSVCGKSISPSQDMCDSCRQEREQEEQPEEEEEEEEEEKWKCPKCQNKISGYPCKYCGYERTDLEERTYFEGTAVKMGGSLVTLFLSALVLYILGFGPMAYGATLSGIILLVVDRLFPQKDPWRYIKIAFRPSGYIAIAAGLMQYIGPRPVLNLIPLLIAATGIFTFPGKVTATKDEDKQYQRLMTVMRTMYSLAVGIIFALTFSAAISRDTLWLATSFLALIGAFFIIIPAELKLEDDSSAKGLEEAGKRLLDVVSGAVEKTNNKTKNKGPLIALLFVILLGGASVLEMFGVVPGAIRWGIMISATLLGAWLMLKLTYKHTGLFIPGMFGLVGLVSGGIALSGNPIGFIIFMIMVSVGLLVAIPVPDARPIMGIIVLPIALMASTAAYPEVMGEAVFGEWWPTVRARAEELEQAMSPAVGGFTQVQDTLGRGWTCLASPMDCYPDGIEGPGEVEKEYQALRLGRLEPTGMGIVGDDYEFSSGFEVRNMLQFGEYINTPVIEELELRSLKPQRVSDNEYIYDEDEGEYGEILGPCEGNGRDDVCRVGDLYPDVMKQYTLKYEKRHLDTDKLEPGEYIRYGIEARYNVKTSSILDVEVLERDYYNELVARNEIDFYSPSSTFEWGPVEIGIAASEQQPLRGGEEVPIIITLRNKDEGEVYLGDIDDKSFNVTYIQSGNGEEKLEGPCEFIRKIEDEYDKVEGIDGLQPKDDEHNSITVQCMYEDIENPEVPRRTDNIRIDMEYEYIMKTVDRIEVMY